MKSASKKGVDVGVQHEDEEYVEKLKKIEQCFSANFDVTSLNEKKKAGKDVYKNYL